jgi:hypothetical protein
MALNLLNASIIAAAAHSTAAIMRMTLAMSITESGQTSIERAATWQTYVFAGYVFLLVLTLVGTIVLYKAGNAYQEAVKSEADARIAEAGNRAAQANDSAQKANERAQNLEHDNLTLRSQVATLETQAADAKKDVAGLQKAAADAKAAQQRVEIDLKNAVAQQQKIQIELARQQERAAKAEMELAEIRGRQEPRKLPIDKFVGALEGKPKGDVEILIPREDGEAFAFGLQLAGALNLAGWRVNTPRIITDDMVAEQIKSLPKEELQKIQPLLRIGAQPFGVSIIANKNASGAEGGGPSRDVYIALMRALKECGFTPGLGTNNTLPDGKLLLAVGNKEVEAPTKR